MKTIRKNNKKNLTTLFWLPIIFLILIFPFSCELLAWGMIDKFMYPEKGDLFYAFVFVIALMVFALIIFRSLFRATVFGFTAISFLIVLFEIRNLLAIFWNPRGVFHFIIGWGISILLASGLASFGFQLISNIMKRPLFPVILSLLSVSLLIFNFLVYYPGGSYRKAKKLPDIILVIMDTTRADHLSVYGYARQTAPGLEWLAQKAAVYEKAISPASWTPPGHASILTGLLPTGHGTDGDFLAFNPPGLTLAESLQASGYQTAAIVNNPTLAPQSGWNRGFQSYKTTWSTPPLSFSRIPLMIKSRHKDWPWFGSTERTLFSARRWWVANRKNSKFLFLNLIDPHSPYGDPHQFKNLFLDAVTKKAPDISNDSEDYDSGLIRAEGAALERVIARYDGDIRFMDFCLETFFRWLEKRFELDQTLIILTSDHGERLGERGLLGHQLGLDHSLLHVPLIVRYPQKISPGRFSDPVQTHGIYSTVFGILGLDLPKDNLKRMPPLEQQHLSVTVAQMRNQGLVLQSLKKRNPKFDSSPFAGDWSSVFDGEWKLYKSNLGNICLFNIKNDPAEEKNLANDFPKQAERLLPYVDALPNFSRGKKSKDLPENVIELLKSLGYVYK